jgi:hypothetical protein
MGFEPTTFPVSLRGAHFLQSGYDRRALQMLQAKGEIAGRMLQVWEPRHRIDPHVKSLT